MNGNCDARLHHDLAELFEPGRRGADDHALLDQFRTTGDEPAFEELVRRHGPMVQGVCRRLLSQTHDADDAFQATFLILVRRAGPIRHAERLGPWLYGVASRVATKARARQARRHECPPVAAEVLVDPARVCTDLIDIPAILDAELGQISARLRPVLILCLLEGITAEAAAAVELGCPVGTVKSRLARGRAVLQSRLVPRGIAPTLASAALLTSFAPPVSAALIRATLGAITPPQPLSPRESPPLPEELSPP